MADPLVAVLAAGRGERFGGGKLDAHCAGQPLGRWALAAVAAAGLKPGVIVVGPDAPVFASETSGWQVLTNADAAGGQATSVALAAKAAAGRPLLIVLADMPLIAPEHLLRLVDRNGNAATRYPDGRAGVPACIAAQSVGQLEVLTGDRGAGPILSGLPGLTLIDVNLETLLDVDTPEDLARAEALLAHR